MTMTSVTYKIPLTAHPKYPSFWDMMKLKFAVARQRHKLAGLSGDALRDIGISQAQADQEASRSFWDTPDHSKY